MPTRRQTIRHLFGGGWSTDYGPNAEITISEDGIAQFPFLVNAENIFFELNGGVHKVGGELKLNTVPVPSAGSEEEVMGIWDYWKMETTSQKRLCKAGTVVYKDDADGTWDSLITGLTDDAVPSFTVFNDLGIYSETGDDVPKKWTQSGAAANLGSNTPNFSFAVPHKNRLWAAGVAGAGKPSRVYYSQSEDADTDWNGSGSGSIMVEADDGDRIMGLASHKNDLWVFKGPYHGSIHRITGSAPTGSDAFALQTFVRGIGCAGHNSIFPFGDDLGFLWSDGSVHTLNAVAAYGDYKEASLSRPINSWLLTRGNQDRLQYAWTANDVGGGSLYLAIPIDASSLPNVLLRMDYRFSPARWSYIPAYNPVCVANIVDAGNNNRPTIICGGDDGYVRFINQATRTLDPSNGISTKVTTPFTSYGNPMLKKTIAYASIGIQPRGAYNTRFSWKRDGANQQHYDVEQGGGDVLGPATANAFTLGTSTLAGSVFLDRHMALEEGGEFSSIQYELRQSGNNQDMEVHSITAVIEGDALSVED